MDVAIRVFVAHMRSLCCPACGGGYKYVCLSEQLEPLELGTYCLDDEASSTSAPELLEEREAAVHRACAPPAVE